VTHNQSILPHFDLFDTPTYTGGPAAQAPEGGLGKYRLFALSPVVAAMKGLGADATVTDPSVPPVLGAPAQAAATGTDVLVGVLLLALVGAASYQAGKAISPSRADASTWGMVAVPVGLFTGALGLGVMGLMANRRKG